MRLPRSRAAVNRRTVRLMIQRPTIQAASAARILSPKSMPWVLRKCQMASVFIIVGTPLEEQQSLSVDAHHRKAGAPPARPDPACGGGHTAGAAGQLSPRGLPACAGLLRPSAEPVLAPAR